MISWTVAHQVPLSMEFSRQEYWSGLPFLPLGDHIDEGSQSGVSDVEQMCKDLVFFFLLHCFKNSNRLESGCCCLVTKSDATLSNPKDCSPPGSSVHGIIQAGILEWVAISFSTV